MPLSLPPASVTAGLSGSAAPGSLSAGVSDRALGDTGQVAVLLCLGRQVQQHGGGTENGQRRPGGAVPADLGQRRREFGQPDAVAAEALGHAQRRHTAGDQRVPAVVPVQYRGDDVGDGLLPFVRTEIHPNPPRFACGVSD